MRQAFAALALALFFGTAPASAQNWAQKLFTNPVHDFGSVAKASNTEHRFEITNTTGKDLVISGVRTSCHCTTPRIEKEVIKPGDTGAIIAKFNTATHQGQRGATVTVTFRSPSFAEAQLQVKGYIRTDVVFSPGEIEFGNLNQGEAKEVEVSLDYAGKSRWEITDIVSPDPYVEVSAKEVSRANGRIKYNLTARLKDDAPVGYSRNAVKLVTNDRNVTSVSLNYSFDVQPVLSVSPQSFQLGNLKPGEPVQQRIAVKSTTPFRVTEIASDDMTVEFQPMAEPNKFHVFTVTMAPKEKPGDLKSVITIKTDLPGEPEVSFGANYTVVSP